MKSNFIIDKHGCIIEKAEYKPNPKNKYGSTNKYLENLEKYKKGLLNNNDKKRKR